ncbi:Mur ligase family protein [Gemmatimonas sp.]|uniref:Mur ligase family protein n=1 Tax=Gemmatimonas sp. TaxID=1962908 RepID=UPI00286E7834|nr:Mur ligase family protein [Gemmatimonas sp.]
MTDALVDEPEYPSPNIRDCRRLQGPNRYGPTPGAVVTVVVVDDDARRAVDHWPYAARRLTQALGWERTEFVARHSIGDATCYLSAPTDGLMTATAVAEMAWVESEAYIGQREVPDAAPMLRAQYAEECARHPHVRELAAGALTRGLAFSIDDEAVSVGSGRGVRTWPHGDAPPSASVAWNDVSDVPLIMVTGSNGKTTTTRLVAAMWRAAGATTGWSCSDGVFVESDVEKRTLGVGDYTGPGGARLVMRDADVQVGVLETARGGMLRRGLGTTTAQVAVITNISADHFGEYGVHTLEDLAEVKAIVTRALGPAARLVLNADDPTLVALGERLSAVHAVPIVWFSMNADTELVADGIEAYGDGAVLHDGHLMLCREGVWGDAGRVHEMPVTADGAARHNVENALAAALTASCAGVSLSAVHVALRRFGAAVHDNAGRLERYAFGGITAFVDYAHNPEGIRALCATAASVVAARRGLVLGNAGDRDDEQLRALARAAWSVATFDRVVVKEMVSLLRGRPEGELPTLLVDELRRCGAADDRVTVSPSEFDAVRALLAWARDGDVLVLPTHAERGRVTAYLEQLRTDGWRAGEALPET